MKRREFIKQSLSASAVAAGAGYISWDMLGHKALVVEKSVADRATLAAAKVLTASNPSADEGLVVAKPNVALNTKQTNAIASAKPESLAHSRPAEAFAQMRAEKNMAHLPAENPLPSAQPVEEIVLTESQKTQTENVVIAKPSESAKSVQEKIENFEANFTDDVVLSEAEYKVMVQTLERINRVQSYVGFGNFNVLSFDEAIKYGKSSPRIGAFSQTEKQFLDMLFNFDTDQLGFFGEKVVGKQTNVISSKDVVKMAGTGHYVFRGHSEVFYNKLRKEVGESLILTSGVRNIVKQYQLFMAKTVQASGNLSRASRSLAPPGHSYHAIGDFDVGQVGGGFKNFTAAFSKTDEFKKLQDLGYVKIRYTADNDLGVRYEPWHIRVV